MDKFFMWCGIIVIGGLVQYYCWEHLGYISTLTILIGMLIGAICGFAIGALVEWLSNKH
ncbi:MAG: hypothetical protein LUC88_05605 [Prevotella sp.]|nr:hypothetical protein [Prevotella sp.]